MTGASPDGIQRLHHGMVAAGADVQDGWARAKPMDGHFDCPGHILDFCEVAALVAAALDIMVKPIATQLEVARPAESA
jgi:hypothetical protein